ncbi:universal stress family protein (macronuclear) [Tetrahymena thermophila SB210]|uniref:Universal stress family protein n=1 Tax=Tetrahymena thermophila (strain SB210) TaxID=312017 RepID=I7M3S2_TETTS|nr:universal stress family protein [Tetrahymena thermophila SB210]EAS03994.2 universal stress family protein [Tetrahymena thermophila SB210]|eukprot:XP_001024239.2 universal stress family protein [Tetrahymena thermophila SB210]
MSQLIEFKNLLVAVDGSDYSRKAYEQSLEFLEQKKDQFDQLIIAHITNRNKKYLPEKMQAETIYDQYKLECDEKFAHNKYKLVFEEKNPNQPSCREQIISLCGQLQISFLFLGFYGRKGVKEQRGLTQTVSQACYHSKVPLVIVKNVFQRKETQSQGFNFLVCIDGSNKSYKALNYALNLAQNPNDKITICYAPTPDKQKFTRTIDAKLQEDLEQAKHINWKFVELTPSYNATEQIIKHVNSCGNEDQFQFVIIGNNGYRAQIEDKSFFGRTAEEITIHSNSNIIIIT